MNVVAIVENSELTVRQKVCAIEDLMRDDPRRVELKVTHIFAPGLYARELFIPKGVLLTGKIHKYPQLNIMSAGDLSVLTDNGIMRVQAPFRIVSPGGTKRIAFAHEDTVWTTIHATEETDVEKIEQQFIAQTEADYLAFAGEFKCLGSE